MFSFLLWYKITFGEKNSLFSLKYVLQRRIHGLLRRGGVPVDPVCVLELSGWTTVQHQRDPAGRRGYSSRSDPDGIQWRHQWRCEQTGNNPNLNHVPVNLQPNRSLGY